VSNPIETVTGWVTKAPLPVAISLILILGGWVYALENRVSEQDVALARIEAKLNQVDTNVQTVLQAVLWQHAPEPKKETR